MSDGCTALRDAVDSWACRVAGQGLRGAGALRSWLWSLELDPDAPGGPEAVLQRGPRVVLDISRGAVRGMGGGVAEERLLGEGVSKMLRDALTAGPPEEEADAGTDGSREPRDRVAEAVLAMCSTDRPDPLDMGRASDARAVSDVAADLAARGVTEPDAEDVAEAALRMRADALDLATSLMRRASSLGRLADAVRGPREVELIDGGLGGAE